MFIEPKGEHLRLGDAWKEEFLTSLQEASICESKMGLLVDSKHVKIVGFPFYNHQRENEFLNNWEATLLEKKLYM